MKEKVIFYPACGHFEDSQWRIPMRAWVYEDRLLTSAISLLPGLLGVSGAGDIGTFNQRARAFVADSESREAIRFRFDDDPAGLDRSFSTDRTDENGIVEGELVLAAEEAEDLLTRQGSGNGWLSFRASSGHEGAGRIQLIPADGLSVISDIDDTIKVTGVPDGAETVVRNTFFRDFVAAPGMADAYSALGATAFHYVSGSPFQLYQVLAEFLLGPAAFPRGTFHLKITPKDLLSGRTWDALCRLMIDPDGTRNHKLAEIGSLMDRFPGRRFILIGDSGEKDPEIYREILESSRGPQVHKIYIRDVTKARESEEGRKRLEGMEPIPGH